MYGSKILLVSLLFIGLSLAEFNFEGSWKEDQYKRENLNELLSAVGMSWFKRIYVTSTSWENTQDISKNGNVYHITGVKGPHAEPFDFSVTTDNTTVSQISMGSLGGMMDATAEKKEDELITYLRNQENGVLEMKVRRKMIPQIEGTDAFEFTNFHIPSGVLYKAIYLRQ